MDRESRDVQGFHEVALRAVGTLLIEQGDRESLTIEAEDDVLPRIITDVRDGRLTIRTTHGLHTRQPIIYTLKVAQLDAIELSGAAAVKAARLQADEFRLVVSGAGTVMIEALTAKRLEVAGSGSSHVELAGTADEQHIRLSGSDAYHAANLASRKAFITIDGASRVTVRVSESLHVDIRGAAAVSYIGEPSVQQHISGVGSLRRLKPEQRATA
jgi:hypothetical protein